MPVPLTEVLTSLQHCSDQGMLIAQQDPKEHTGSLQADCTTERAVWPAQRFPFFEFEMSFLRPQSHCSLLSYTQTIHLHLLLDPQGI